MKGFPLTPSDRPVVAAVIAAYSPAPALVPAVTRLLEQVDDVCVVDDGSPAGSEIVLKELEEAGATVVRQPFNMGIAAALNAGVASADLRVKPGFFITLDQDSQLNADYVERALATYEAASEAGISVGFVCASSYSGHPVPVLRQHGPFAIAFDPMQSGFFIPRSTIEDVGEFESGLFIDGVDSEFTMRTRAAGREAIVGQGCDIEHDLGQREPGLFFGKPVKILGRDISYNYHSPSRVYYIARNGTLLSRRYILKDPAWVLRRLVEELKAHLLRFAFSKGRGKLLLATGAGFADAVRGRTGRIPQSLERRLRQKHG